MDAQPTGPAMMPAMMDENQPPAVAPRKARSVARKILSLSAKALLPIAVLAMGYAAFAGLKATKPEPPAPIKRDTALPVTTLAAAYGVHQPTLTVFGTTASGRRVEMRARVAGPVVSVGDNLRDGAEVAEGETLLTIDPFQFEGAVDEARAQLAEAKARLAELEASLAQERASLATNSEQLAIAERDLDRAEPLAKRGTVTEKLADDRRTIVVQRRQAVEQSANLLKVWQARIDQQRAAIDRLDWRVRQAERNLADTTLKAPFAGYIAGVNAELGKVLSVNDTVARILDRGWIEVRFVLSDADYGRLSASGGVIGRPAEVIWQLGERRVVYPAKVVRIGSEIASETGGVALFARLDDPLTPAPIRPGAFVTVQVTDQAFEDALRLPRTAVYGSSRVYVVKDGRLSAREITLIGAIGEDVLVRGAVSPGERILVTRLSAATDGMAVKDEAARATSRAPQTDPARKAAIGER